MAYLSDVVNLAILYKPGDSILWDSRPIDRSGEPSAVSKSDTSGATLLVPAQQIRHVPNEATNEDLYSLKVNSHRGQNEPGIYGYVVRSILSLGLVRFQEWEP